MKFSTPLFLIGGFFALMGTKSFGQNFNDKIQDSLQKKFEYYRSKKGTGVLFAHFDKTVYTNNENVWFTAYLLNDTDKRKNDVLSVILVKDDDTSIVLEGKFVMVNGLSTGNLFLPDTVSTGKYSFLLYTNSVINGKPTNVFTQPITIKNNAETSFNAFLHLLDTAKRPVGGRRKVLLITDAKGGKLLSGAVVKYYAGNKLHHFISGKVKTDKAGQFLFDIPSDSVNIGNNSLNVQISWGKEIKNINLVLPVIKPTLTVRFYPEGGNLSNGVGSCVGWEVKDKASNAYKVTGVLFKDGEPIDTISTDSYGMGKFFFAPIQKASYYVKLLLANYKDSIYYLPKIESDFPVVTISNALAEDTLQMVIKSRLTKTVNVVVHNYKQIFFSFPVAINADGKKIKVVLSSLPKGIAEITVSDSTRRPLAERLFFAHRYRRNSVTINTDKDEYKKREQLHVKLNLVDASGKPIAGIVSIACVQANRVEPEQAQNIENYFYLYHELGCDEVPGQYSANYLEDILLIKGWRRYKWNDLIKINASDTIRHLDSLTFKGMITNVNKPLKKAVGLILLNDSSLRLVNTTKTGAFGLNDKSLYSYQDKKIYLFVAGRRYEGYNINLNDPYKKIDRGLATTYVPVNYTHLLVDKTGDKADLDNMQSAIHLREVKIKGTRDNSVYDVHQGGTTENACGDYVCKYNILNCPNHRNDPDNTPPVTGQLYIYQGTPFYRYGGCEIKAPAENKKIIQGIHYSMEYYPADYSRYNPATAEFISTIYWKHLYKIAPGKSNVINFFTSDITGKFKIIVQGIGGNDVVYGEEDFVVTKP